MLSLMDLGSVYYEILNREDPNTLLVVLFFDDPIIDVTAEVLKVKACLRTFPCET